jgi:hypothetical protein
VLVRADSKLLVDQMNGDSRVKNAALVPLAAKVRELRGQFDNLMFEHVPRENSKLRGHLLEGRGQEEQGLRLNPLRRPCCLSAAFLLPFADAEDIAGPASG